MMQRKVRPLPGSGPAQGFRRVFHLDVDHQLADAEQLRDLSPALAGHLERYPSVAVQPVVLRGRAASVLRDHAVEHQGALLVLGGQGADDAADQMLGSTTRALLAYAEVPVAVIHHRLGA